jgi:ethanolamine ammonia-lyase large subunit
VARGSRACRFPAAVIGATFAVMAYRATLGGTTWTFESLADLMAKASPPRSGDALAGIAAASAQHNVAAKMALADVPLKTFLTQALVPYEPTRSPA